MIYLLLVVGASIAIGSCLLSYMRFNVSSAAESMVWGFQFLTIGVTIPIIFLNSIPTIYVSLIPVIALATFMFWRSRRENRHNSNIPTLKSAAVLIVLVVGLYGIGLFTLRYHSSPDNHGFVSAISYLRDQPSLSLLEAEFVRESGATAPVALGQSTSRLNSTWNTPDARLRFAADMILTVGRVGLPAVLAVFSPFTRSPETLGQLILISSWIGAVAIGFGIARTIEELKYIRSAPSGSQFSQSSKFTGVVVVTVTSPLLTVMMVEGTATQIWTLAVSISTLAMVLRVTRTGVCQTVHSSPLLMTVGPLFLSVVYPHGLIVCSTILLMGAVLGLATEYRLQRKLLPALYPYLFCIAICTPVIYRTSRHTFIPMLRQFASGVSGVPYNLGFLRWEGAIFWILSSIKFTAVTGPGSGFADIPKEMTSGIPYVVASAACLIVLLRGSRPLTFQRVIAISGTALVSLTFSLPYLQQALRTTPTVNSYIFNRNLALAVLFIVPIMVSALEIMLDMIRKILQNRTQRLMLAGAGAVIVAAQAVLFLLAINDFQRSSTQFAKQIDPSVLAALSHHNSVFLSERPEHQYFQLTAFGEFKYLTDGWEPRLGACYYDESCSTTELQSQFEVYWLSEYVAMGKFTITAESVGTLILHKPLDGPVFLPDLINIKTFSPRSRYFEILTR